MSFSCALRIFMSYVVKVSNLINSIRNFNPHATSNVPESHRQESPATGPAWPLPARSLPENALLLWCQYIYYSTHPRKCKTIDESPVKSMLGRIRARLTAARSRVPVRARRKKCTFKKRFLAIAAHYNYNTRKRTRKSRDGREGEFYV